MYEMRFDFMEGGMPSSPYEVVRTGPGDLVSYIARIAVERADGSGKPVTFIANDRAVTVNPGDPPSEVMARHGRAIPYSPWTPGSMAELAVWESGRRNESVLLASNGISIQVDPRDGVAEVEARFLEAKARAIPTAAGAIRTDRASGAFL